MSKTVKYSIIGVLVLVTIVIVYFILSSGGTTATAGTTPTTTPSGGTDYTAFCDNLSAGLKPYFRQCN